MKKAGCIIAVVLSVLYTSCATKEFAPPATLKALPVTPPANVTTEKTLRYVIIEKPVYIVSDAITENDIPMLDQIYAEPLPENAVLEQVQESTQTPTGKLIQWNHATVNYDYQEDMIYHVYGSPFRITDIQLQRNEQIVGTPVVGDSTYWMITGETVRGEPHVYLKPTETNLETTLIINTNLRKYYLIIRSYDQKYMTTVRWNYPLEALQRIGIQTTADEANAVLTSPATLPVLLGNQLYHIYSFNYKIRTPLKEPVWTPVQIYDDGEKTYIEFPQDITSHFSPTVHLKNKRKRELVNYRFQETTLIIDRLIEEAFLSYEKTNIRITKEKGANNEYD